MRIDTAADAGISKRLTTGSSSSSGPLSTRLLRDVRHAPDVGPWSDGWTRNVARVRRSATVEPGGMTTDDARKNRVEITLTGAELKQLNHVASHERKPVATVADELT